MNWQPIETAPKDGTQVLVYGGGCYAVAAWDGEEWRDVGDIGWAGMHGDGNQPTHWMPLLPPDSVSDPIEQWLDLLPAVTASINAKRREINQTSEVLPKDRELPAYISRTDHCIEDRRTVEMQPNGEYILRDPVTHVVYDMSTGEVIKP